MNWTIVYFNEDVQEAIGSWPVGLRVYYARITERMRIHGPNLGLPFTRSMGHGLLEIRVKGKEGMGRAFFCTLVGRKIVILHADIKKSRKTPAKELEIARQRFTQIQKQGER
ncbi:MAG: type II toxin-antitoxin system RelE/ParE family toxin [Candidatus Omnitrophota bacterium]|jgi:phage-related protein|nr:MAG: type II toxin-antitoxin system RelE/ParE family toxin [Candidatus Omnitrophota bacterium]